MTCARRHSISHYCTWKRTILVPLVILLASCMDATPPIIKAVESGSLEKVRKAIRYKADLEAVDQYGNTGLMIAIQGKRHDYGNRIYSYGSPNFDIAKALIKAGANVNADNRSGVTVLDCAIGKAQLDLIKQLIEKGAKINALDDSTLTKAIECRNFEIFNYLFEKTKDVKQTSAYVSAMRAAAEWEAKAIPIMTKLLERGASVKGSFYAAAECGNLKAMEFLLQHGADVNETGSSGISGLACASLKGDLKTVRFLLDRGADLSKENTQYNALYYALFNGHTEIADLLIEKGIDTSGALVLAAEKGQVSIMKKLFTREVNTNETNTDGYTPLTVAVIRGGYDAVQFLIENGVDVNHPDKNGMTALQYAQEFEDQKMIKLLKNAGAKE